MALSTTTQQTLASNNTAVQQPQGDSPAASLLSAIFLTVYAGQKSRKQLRQLKRKAAWLMVKQKASSMFTRTAATERQIILYVLIGILALVLVFYYPIAALVLAIVGLILFLTGTI
jgi:fatty acid desaturase